KHQYYPKLFKKNQILISLLMLYSKGLVFCFQVILVQVNPGETFTIRTEDGHIQCIQGPAHVPMVSPNGSVPPIFVPPGYVSQMVEENGVRKVMVLPHSSEFHPSMHPPPPHVPHYMHPHPALLPHPPHPVYSPVPGTGEIPPQFIHQPPPPTHQTYLHYLWFLKVSDIQARSAVLSWNLSVSSQNGESQSLTPATFIFEVAVSNSGKNGKFKSVYIISATSSSIKESVSELVSFTTESCEPDPPAAPKLINRTKNSLSLQWKGKSGAFIECYYGNLKQYKLTKLSPATKYLLRLAAKNDIGMSGFSDTVAYYTAGIVPSPPLPPQFIEAGVTWLSLKWSPPNGMSSDDSLTYTLDMEEEDSGYGFQPKYNGEELSCTLKNLRRNTSYKFRLSACNNEGKSIPSEVVEYSTIPDKPGPPSKPSVKGKIHSHTVKVTWDPPKNNGGSDISKYFLEISETLIGSNWVVVYSGCMREHVCDHLKPGTSYRLRVSCVSKGGESPVTVPPGPCHAPCLVSKAKPREITLQWGPPSTDGGSEVTEYVVEMANSEQDEHRQVYQGLTRECTVNNLLPGRMYCFWIRAGNKAGFGPLSEKAEISTAAGPPDQCSTPLLTCKAATCVVVTWESPVCNGAEICEYRLDWGQMEGSMRIIYTGPCLSYEVKGLTPATTYYCRVQAVNIAGVGLFGDIGVVTTPASVPAAVSVLHLLEEDQMGIPCYLSACLAIQWEEPCCHGSDVIGYNIEYGEKQLVTVGRVTSHILENLHADTLYRIRIQAINNFGVGPFSHSIKAKTKPLPPDPPHLECVVFSYQSLKLKWGEGPSRALITNPTQFNLQMEDKFGRFVTVYSGPCHTYKVQRLNESTTYYFKIQAYIDAGEGEFSEVYAFTTIRSPPVSLKAPKVNQVGENICEITWEPLQSMKIDSIVYILQLASGREVDQVYKGSETSFHFTNFQTNCEYRFRVCAGRQYHDSTGLQELYGPYSPSTVFSSQKQELVPQCTHSTAKFAKIKKMLNDERFAAFLLLVGFAVVAILFAFVIQYFVIK
uniref:Fibronectin type-III domain-containing protein n=1 Tax=Chelonoidis abingdonii TaxID=106734 RepID=A0A8C0GLE6_CHEAB